MSANFEESLAALHGIADINDLNEALSSLEASLAAEIDELNKTKEPQVVA